MDVIHLQKLSVGSESLDTLKAWQQACVKRHIEQGRPPFHHHVTRLFPKQRDALLNGGSIYWIIKGLIQCRNVIVDLKEVRTKDGRRACAIIMEPNPIATVPTARRAFQGWRYLKPQDAPADLDALSAGASLPPDFRNKLVRLGLW